jgi:hypothetical protein
MNMTPDMPSNRLPVRSNLAPAYAASIAIALLTAAASGAGLLLPGSVYPTAALAGAFLPTDAVNLILGLPILAGSMVLTARGKPIGLLLWPGALFFLFYTYLAYVFSLPPGGAFLLDLLLVTAAAYGLIDLTARLDPAAIRARLAGAVPERLCGGALALLSALFLLRAAGVLAGSAAAESSAAESATAAADILASPAWLLGGILLWRRAPLGYAAGLGLLFSLSMLFVGLTAVMLLQPADSGTAFAAADVAVVAGMGAVCSIPFVLFLRGAVARAGA